MTHARVALNRFRSAAGKPSSDLSLSALLSTSDDAFYSNLQRTLNQSLAEDVADEPAPMPLPIGRGQR